MIGVRLMGGLGNQMFQYAAAKRLAHDNRQSLIIDLAFYDTVADVNTPRIYELDNFALSGNALFLAPEKRPIEDDAIYSGFRGKLRAAHHMILGKSWHIFREKHHNFDPAMLTAPNNTYLIGYWQSEKYFRSIRDQLLRDFSLSKEPRAEVKTLLKRVSSNNSVSVHIRRGDYVSNPHASKFHGTKGLDYYEKAVERIAETVKNPELFVISDDIEWCKENLRLPYKTTHIDGNAGFEDMHIMSHCAHNIIANSSFSWWAAWLNTNPDKVVIAPKKWFNDESINTEDVVPKTWIRL